MLTVRPAANRGHSNFDWLDSWHTFSFGEYFDPQHMGFGPLRVINEDRVSGGEGFPTHPHSDMEIVTYVLAGALEHKDSLGTGSVIRPGEIQAMSAGRGIRHSEFNHSKDQPVHFLQIWLLPNKKGIAPRYQQQQIAFTDGLTLIASHNAPQGVVDLQADARIYAATLKDTQQIMQPLAAHELTYVQVAKGAVSINGSKLAAGDGAALANETALNITSHGDSEILVFALEK